MMRQNSAGQNRKKTRYDMLQTSFMAINVFASMMAHGRVYSPELHTHLCGRMGICVYIYVFIYAYISVYKYTYTHIHIHIYAYTYAHMNIYIYRYTDI